MASLNFKFVGGRENLLLSYKAKDALPGLAGCSSPARSLFLAILPLSKPATWPYFQSSYLPPACLPAVSFPTLFTYSSSRYLSIDSSSRKPSLNSWTRSNPPIICSLAPCTYLCSFQSQFSLHSFCDCLRNACLPHQTPGRPPCLSSSQHPSTWHVRIYPWNGPIFSKSEHCLFSYQGNLNITF